MNIEEAIAQFEAEHHKTYLPKDRAKILAVVAELGITEFTVTKDHISNIKTGVVNLANEIGIHSTMIVAGMPFAGSEYRPYNPEAKKGEFKGYEHREHHVGLDGRVNRDNRGRETGGATKVNCGGVMVPIGTECSYCGEVHQEELDQ